GTPLSARDRFAPARPEDCRRSTGRRVVVDAGTRWAVVVDRPVTGQREGGRELPWAPATLPGRR
ncbi:hypothetical protein ACFT0E_32140, partial [Streptomyces sp. NPDC057052]